jgi:hypothetical protein
MTRVGQFEPGEKQAESLHTLEFRASVNGALFTEPRDCYFPLPPARLRALIESSSERGSMARKRYQKGQLWLERERWYGRWREDVLSGGVRRRVRVQKEIGTRQEYPTKRLAQRELDKRIEHVNAISYRPRPTATFAQFAENWEREVLSQFGESTAVNYRTHIRRHLVPFFRAACHEGCEFRACPAFRLQVAGFPEDHAKRLHHPPEHVGHSESLGLRRS